MREDTVVLLPALIIAIYQTKLWKSLTGNDIALINGKYKLQHLLGYIFAKYTSYLLFTFQLFFNLFKITDKYLFFLYVLGYFLIISGLFLSTMALRELKNNWDNMMFYKIIHNHELVKSGIYKHVRHPIYCALILEIVGFELIANSWLFLFFLTTLILTFEIHIKNEEQLLIKHFGKRYLDYMKQTKKYIPFVY